MAQLKDLIVSGPARFLGKIIGDLNGNADTATRATQDAAGNVITSTYATKDETRPVFIATYGETTSAELLAAYAAGKTIYVTKDNYRYYPLNTSSDGRAYEYYGADLVIGCINGEWYEADNLLHSYAPTSFYNGVYEAVGEAVSVSQSLTSGTQIGTITVNDTETILYAPTNTDEKVTMTVAPDVTSATTRYPIMSTSSSTNTSTTVKRTSLAHTYLTGTTSTNGYDQLKLGNGTATGTAGNSYGKLTLYSASSGAHNIIGTSTTSEITHTLPNTAGTFVNSGTISSYLTGYSTTNHDHSESSINPTFIELFPGTSVNHGGYIDFHYNNNSGDYTSRIWESASGTLTVTGNLGATKVTGAVWNDYAEYRRTDNTIEPGRVVIEVGDDTMTMSTERLQPGASIVSDTFGFSIGETEDCKTPIAVSGRALVYTYEDRYEFEPGDAVCAAPNGTVSKMTREEIREYPERIVGVVSAIPEYETWGSGKVEVNGRIWVKVR